MFATKAVASRAEIAIAARAGRGHTPPPIDGGAEGDLRRGCAYDVAMVVAVVLARVETNEGASKGTRPTLMASGLGPYTIRGGTECGSSTKNEEGTRLVR